MKQYFLTLATAIAVACGTVPAQGGTLGPALQQAASSSAAQVALPVIIRFVDQVDIKALRAEVKRIARERYPDDAKKRKKERRKLMRKMLADNLKDKAKDSKKHVKDFLRDHGEKSKLKLIWSQNSVVADIPVHLLGELAAQSYVDRIVLDATIQAPGTGTAPTAFTNWNLNATGVQSVWATGNTGQDVVVATLDTGVDATHPDLGPRFRGGASDWFDPYDQHSTPADNNGHGTQVLGLIVGGAAYGYQVGMAPDSQWIAAKIFDDSNEATLSGIHEAFQWVLDPDGNSNTDDVPDIVNNSWDLASTVNQCVQEFAPDIALLKAVDIAVVFAGGNYGPDEDSSVSPANDPGVLSVGAVDSTLGVDVLSSRGANACNGGVYPSLVAPGDSVLTTGRMPGFYNIVSGTSFAVAHLAGGMAVLKSAFPDASVTEFETSLTETATDLGAEGADFDYGYGLMDLVAAHSHLAAILGGGNPGSLQLSGTSYSVDENVASLTVTVTRTGGSAGDVSVDFSTADDTALVGADYTATSGTLVFADGEMSRSFDVTILDDSVYEGDEDFTVELSNVQGDASLGTPMSAPVTILEDDPQPQPGTLSLSAASYSIAENGASIIVTVNRTGGSDGAVSVDYATADDTATAGADYNATSGTLNFADNEISRTFTVTITDDAAYEGNEKLNLALSNPAGGAALGTTANAVLTIIEDDSLSNNPPAITSIPVTTAADGEAYGYDVAATDPDQGDTLTFSLDVSPAGMNIDSASGLIDWTPTGQAGPNDVIVRVTDAGGLFDTQSFTIDVSEAAPPAGVQLYFSTAANATVPSVGGTYDDADIYHWDGSSFSRVFDASAAGLPGNADVDALVVDGAVYYMSFRRNGGTNVPGLGLVDDEDIVKYEGGAWSLYFDGGAVGLADSNGEDVDGFELLPNGDILVSTVGNAQVPGLGGTHRDEDLLRCQPAAVPVTSCSWSMYFDGSDVALNNSGGEDVDGVSVSSDGNIQLSTVDAFNVAGLSGNDEDVFVCNSPTTGTSTACASFTLLFDGNAEGVADDLDAIDLP